MDPFRHVIALGPLAVYLLLVGAINVMRRPVVTSGARDTASLGVAVAGMVLVGPFELLLPRDLFIELLQGRIVWTLGLLLYLSLLALVVLYQRPRLVVYNSDLQRVSAALSERMPTLDGEAQWVGDIVVMPSLGVTARLTSFALFRSVSVVAAGGQQTYYGWRQLETALASSLRGQRSTRGFMGFVMFAAGVALVVLLCVEVALAPI